MAFENVVRPFVAVDPSPARRVLFSSTKLAALVEPDLSATGDPAIYQWSQSSSSSNKESTDNREVKRTTSEVRVENPDDPTQYVMVQRIEDVTFGDQTDPRKQTTFYFDNSDT